MTLVRYHIVLLFHALMLNARLVWTAAKLNLFLHLAGARPWLAVATTASTIQGFNFSRIIHSFYVLNLWAHPPKRWAR